jgi:precorrin-6B methylase 2
MITCVLTAMNISPNATFVDLGSGFGLACFVASMTMKCRSIGVERDSHLVDWSKSQKVENCFFICSDIGNVTAK